MDVGGFSLDQLMELAGLSVSQAGMTRLHCLRIVYAFQARNDTTDYSWNSVPVPPSQQGEERPCRVRPRK